ncbi:hypothetical protein MPSEU_000335700 [Mayamaea pseudoterrestris]|nr:hypothetical protein MPSEU_000335700 [Mayamaea pseudoterrestris]
MLIMRFLVLSTLLLPLGVTSYSVNDFIKERNLAKRSASPAYVSPSSLSQASIARLHTNMMLHRDTIRMPSETPMVPYKSPNSQYAQFIDITAAMYKDRTLFISKFIDENTANSIISTLLYLRKESSRDPISIYLNCPGGWQRPALAVYDLIQNTKKNCKVETVNLGLCAGMGAMLCASGTKGYRSCMPNARFIMSRTGMEQAFRGQATDIALEVKNNKLWNSRMEEELSLLTGQKLETIQQNLKRDFYLVSEEAVQFGLIDKVLLPNMHKRSARGGLADLGQFEGDSTQRYQGNDDQQGGGWGSRQQQQQPPSGGNNDDDDDEPKIAKG